MPQLLPSSRVNDKICGKLLNCVHSAGYDNCDIWKPSNCTRAGIAGILQERIEPSMIQMYQITVASAVYRNIYVFVKCLENLAFYNILLYIVNESCYNIKNFSN